MIDPVLVLLENGSRIVAQAGTGIGGAISITADLFLKSDDSVVDASAGDPRLSGTVEIRSPDVNISGTLKTLPESFLDAAELIRERCAARRVGSAGSLVLSGRQGLPPSPDGFLLASHVESSGR